MPDDLPLYTADAPHGLPPYPADALGGPASPPAPDSGFDATAAVSTRAVLVASWLGAAALVGARVPLARVFESHHAGAASALALALAAFAPGLIGYGVSANLSRVLYALGRNRAPALAISAGWLLVVAADLLIVPAVPRARVVPALGLATSIGLTFAGLALVVLVARFRGAASLAGVPRAFLAGLIGCAAAAAAGSAVAALLRVTGFFPNVGITILVGAVVTGVFAVVVLNVDGGDLRAALRRLRSRVPAVEP